MKEKSRVDHSKFFLKVLVIDAFSTQTQRNLDLMICEAMRKTKKMVVYAEEVIILREGVKKN